MLQLKDLLPNKIYQVITLTSLCYTEKPLEKELTEIAASTACRWRWWWGEKQGEEVSLLMPPVAALVAEESFTLPWLHLPGEIFHDFRCCIIMNIKTSSDNKQIYTSNIPQYLLNSTLNVCMYSLILYKLYQFEQETM